MTTLSIPSLPPPPPPLSLSLSLPPSLSLPLSPSPSPLSLSLPPSLPAAVVEGNSVEDIYTKIKNIIHEQSGSFIWVPSSENI